MPIEFYQLDISAACRGVWMTLEELGIEFTKHNLDLMKGEQKTEEYAKISPNQTIPGIKDGSLAMGESKAIACYLCNAYGEKQGKTSLYPTDPKQRARVDMMLNLHDGLYEKILSYVNSPNVIASGENGPIPSKIDKAHSTLALFERFLNETKFIAGDNLTIADFFYYIMDSMLTVAFNDYEKYPKVVAWKAEMAKLPYHKETCEVPINQVKFMYTSALERNGHTKK